MRDLLQDIRYGLRRLLKGPGFTLAVTLVLALGIGATTAIFSVLDVALLRPLPYPEPERLVAVYDVQAQSEVPVSFPEYLDWKQNTEVFADLGAYFTSAYAMTGLGEPETLQAVRMSASVPRMLGVMPRVGRSFTPGEDVRGAERVAMISEGLWKRRFGGDPGLLGRTITLADQPYTVIGIIPPGTRSIIPTALATAEDFDIWVPLQLDLEHAPRDLHFMNILGQLRPGLDFALAEERTAAFAHRLQDTKVTDHGIHIAPLKRLVIGDARPLLIALMGAVGMVLLIACTNVANLLLVRSTVRRREIAIRAALGAARGRLVRQFLAESLLLALLGGGCGVLVAWAGVAGLRALGPSTMPRLAETTVDARLLGFALALSLATGLLFGLLPALRASRADLGEVIKEGVRVTAGGPARDRLRSTLIVAEVALSFALLIGAGLLLRSLNRLLEVDKGFDAHRVITGSLSLPSSRYPEARQQAAFFRELRESVKALPGVEAAACVSNLPLIGGISGTITIKGREFPRNAQPFAEKRIASPGYFEVLRTPVLSGRPFQERDVAGAPPVVVVNQAFAERYFPGESALGKSVDFGWDTTGMQEIVGVVANVREQALHQPAGPTIYIPLAQRPANWSYLIVRTKGDPLGLAPALRRTVTLLDRNLPIADMRTLEEVVAAALAERRLAMALFGVFSVLSLVLAALGLYAVISYMVVQRRQEIGIRMALGARAEQVVRSVLGQGLMLIVAGVICGAVAALWLGRFLAGLVFGVGTTDPVTFGSVALLLATTALLASMIPALRATHVDPASVLRGE